MNRAFQRTRSFFLLNPFLLCNAKRIKNKRIYNRIIAGGCRCCWYSCSQSFPERSLAILLVASTFLAHFSKRFWVAVPSVVHKFWRELEKRGGTVIVVLHCPPEEFIAALFFALLSFSSKKTISSSSMTTGRGKSRSEQCHGKLAI